MKETLLMLILYCMGMVCASTRHAPSDSVVYNGEQVGVRHHNFFIQRQPQIHVGGGIRMYSWY